MATEAMRSGKSNVDGGLQVRLREDGNDGTTQSWMETSSLWTVLHRK